MLDKNKILTLIFNGKSYKEIADTFGVSPQRIQQLNKPDPSTITQLKSRANNRCEYCGLFIEHGHVHHIHERDLDTYHDLSNLKYLCVSCHTRVDIKRREYKCLECGRKFYKGWYSESSGSFCSVDCRKNHTTVSLVCAECGKHFNLWPSQYRARCRSSKNRDKFYCSKQCWGKAHRTLPLDTLLTDLT
jgi:DNA-directed RNA polymerase subunit RPC12/RpoP